MEITITEPAAPLPTQRAYALSMTIRTFKGRSDVQVHLFRPSWEQSEETAFQWSELIQSASEADMAASRKVILEAFTKDECDQIVSYLKEHYSSRLTAIHGAPMEFPVPAGLPALCDCTEGKSVGFIRFEKIPHFDLPLELRGLYDLSCHEPIVQD